MIPFPTTAQQREQIPFLTLVMHGEGLAPELVLRIAELAKTDQGVFDLMTLWCDTEDEVERALIVDDVRSCLKDYTYSSQ